MEKQKTSKREWVKTFAIIFLVILLILTFFSNTIMNRSLPEVATQSVTSGSINAKIRGTGTVSANETYDVTISQTRKIRSVLVKVGDQVSAGDPLFMLEASESDELKQAQDSLDQMVLSYQKSLIEASNSSSTENREVQKLREAYNEALETYRLYSTADPSQITRALEQAKVTLTDLQRAQQDADEAVSEASSDSAYAEAQKNVTDLQTEASGIQGEIDTAKGGLDKNLPSTTSGVNSLINDLNSSKRYLQSSLTNAQNQYKTDADTLVSIPNVPDKTNEALYKEYVSFANGYLDLCSTNVEFLKDFMRQTLEDESLVTDDYAKALQNAYILLTSDQENIDSITQQIAAVDTQIAAAETQADLLYSIDSLQNELDFVNSNLRNAESIVASWADKIERLQKDAKEAKRAVEDQQALVDKYTQASSAASTLKAAEEALEDKVFTVNLGDSGSLDLQAAKKAIEEQEKLVEELTSNADGQEVTANVSGVISAINVTAGNTAGAETALATITVADRGYTVNISVTNDQAKQVKIGDAASISNYYYGDLTATLENIINDPQAMGKGKILVFRLSGDVEAGSNITLSIGQRSANYDAIVPNSALRSDANGDFVLVVTSKSSPLGNRYVATRADVQKLASDDTTTAVSGLAAGDFVITTSTKPIEAGEQVRLVDNG
ncbi:MAG: HlyD family efflux transporter periplasmic adaptor subunit [Candidatus Avoscillospira sp.]